MITERPMPRFSKNDIVDIRTHGAKLGDWEMGEVLEVCAYRNGATKNPKTGVVQRAVWIYKVKTFPGEILTVKEYNLAKSDS